MKATERSTLPDPGMEIDPTNTALLVTDPQNDFLSPDGVVWGVVGKSVEANGTVDHIETLFKLAKANDIPVFVSPHYYYPTDHAWQFEGALEKRVYPGFPTPFWGLSGFFVGDLIGKALWKLVENAQRFPRRGGRVLCVHGAVSSHRARPCATR